MNAAQYKIINLSKTLEVYFCNIVYNTVLHSSSTNAADNSNVTGHQRLGHTCLAN